MKIIVAIANFICRVGELIPIVIMCVIFSPVFLIGFVGEFIGEKLWNDPSKGIDKVMEFILGLIGIFIAIIFLLVGLTYLFQG